MIVALLFLMVQAVCVTNGPDTIAGAALRLKTNRCISTPIAILLARHVVPIFFFCPASLHYFWHCV